MSWNAISIDELAKIIKTSNSKLNTNFNDHSIDGLKIIGVSCKVANQLTILILVGIAIIIYKWGKIGTSVNVYSYCKYIMYSYNES